MRGAITGLLIAILTLVVPWFSIYQGLEHKSWAAFFVSLAGGVFLMVLITRAGYNIGRKNMDSWLASVHDCDYKYAWDGDGIAINMNENNVYLASSFERQAVSRTYPLSDVKEWGFVMPGATKQKTGQVIGGGVSGVSHNLGSIAGDAAGNTASEMAALEETGLWLRVKDIDYPKWFIRFRCRTSQDKKTETELERWMEILRQGVNRDRTLA